MENDHPLKDKINSKISGESLKDTFKRVVPYFNKKIKPHCDNFHIIVVNPHNQFQIGTVSTVVNSV